MARTNKDFLQKKNILAENTWNLFLENGYETTTLSMIIKNLNISKGAFYHYFESKEDCLDCAIEKYINKNFTDLKNLLDSNSGSAIEKFKLVLSTGLKMHNEDETNTKNVHTSSNAILHQKLLVAMTKEFSKIFDELIIQGIKENTFKTDYPLEVAQTILSISNFLLNIDLFHWTKKELITRTKVLEETITLLLHAKKGTFSYINQFI